MPTIDEDVGVFRDKLKAIAPLRGQRVVTEGPDLAIIRTIACTYPVCTRDLRIYC
jgi:hypothetical protein